MLPTIVVATAFRSLGVERSLVAIVAAHCFFNVAVVARVVGTTWRRTRPAARRRRECSVRDRCGPSYGSRCPRCEPSIAAAASVVFLFCFTSFGVILVLGGPQYATLETEIYRQTAELLDLRTAAALSVVQLVAVLAVLAVAGALAGRARPTRVRPPEPRPLAGTALRLAAAASVLPALLLIVAPTVELLRRSLADDAAGYRQLATVPLRRRTLAAARDRDVAGDRGHGRRDRGAARTRARDRGHPAGARAAGRGSPRSSYSSRSASRP